MIITKKLTEQNNELTRIRKRKLFKTLQQKYPIDLSNYRCDTVDLRHNRAGYICFLRRLFANSIFKIKYTAYHSGGRRMILLMTRFTIFMAVLGAVTMFVGMIMLIIMAFIY